MEPGPSGQEDMGAGAGGYRGAVAAMEPGPSGQEDPGVQLAAALTVTGPQWSLALQARKTLAHRPDDAAVLVGAAMEPGPSGQEDHLGCLRQ